MTSFEPLAWTAPKAPDLRGAFEENDRLSSAKLVPVPHAGPEDVVVDNQGTMFTGTEDGSILRITPEGAVGVVAEVGGRPLGVERYGEDLLICNAYLGLQRVSLAGAVDTLTDSHHGAKLVLTNNASVASDGTIYFSESSTRWPLNLYATDLVEGNPTGRLLRRSLSGDVTELISGLQFANGVALDGAEDSVFIAETGRYRIHRHWLTGDRAGQTEIFVDNLPGFPDNLSFSEGTLWVAYASPRQPMLDAMGARTWMKHVAHRLPEALKPKPLRHGMVFGYDDAGNVSHNFQDPSGRIAITTSARVVDGMLYVGVLSDPHMAVLSL